MRRMALTEALVTRAARAIADTGPTAGSVYMDEADYRAAVDAHMARLAGADLWVFAYGSLLWKPTFEAVETRTARVHGWHRSFCFRVARFRGTPEAPGLMMSLDRGGQVRGVVQRVPVADAAATLDGLFRREVMIKPSINSPRWVTAITEGAPVLALTFVVNRALPHYAGRLPPEAVADVLATAGGHWGSCAEYLQSTVSHLEALGIHDRNLWRLQAMVADRLSRIPHEDAGAAR